ncbi:hypothetical protein [Mycobacterium talmoniae]|uniref:Uncharacterized protein n=1 Tax=Mycobacterium talmoniae TaxID=1858794 RepID=A0A1S1NKL8_9MYCO|nr:MULTISPECIES: hypothetical protein [Mycobacterium]OHV03039.1 hypothetical protein BKN37_15590 [Mycobacterium talmoniae]PQM45243.1 hypothetical protein C1Y40_04602 [Mycobacterium talmoniae]TDH50137.1 hypothetical protein E2F47_18915 [Mycobacterium eburneum]
MSLYSQTEPANPVDAVKNARSPAESTQSATAVLITEQEVLFGTAAAVRAPRTGAGQRFTRAVQQMLMGLVAWVSDPRPHYPNTRDYLEPSRMAREMLRL